jgi:hypothetical protein
MTARRIVVTGAHSYLGGHTLAHLRAEPNAIIDALITPWADPALQSSPDGRVQYHRVDLSKPLPEPLTGLLAQADRVLHLAWVRGSDAARVERANLDMVESLTAPMPVKSRFLFVSSAAAAADTPGIYGRTKWRVAGRVRALGGTVLVCGLVVDEDPQGPYRLLHNVVAKTPIALRFKAGASQVYPVTLPELLDYLDRALTIDAPAGTYRMFPRAVEFNDFIAGIEALYPRRRMQVRLNARTLLALARVGKRLPLAPALLLDKVHSFLYKNDAFLQGCPEPPAAA